MKGTITRRGKTSWRLKYDLPRDPQSGVRRIAYQTVRGTRADAERELRRHLTAIDKGVHVDPLALTVAAFLDSWLDDVAPASVGPKALERYRGLVRNQITPHLGAIPLQKLRPADIARWHQTLGKTKHARRRTMLSTRTIRHAHGVLRTALGYAAAVELIERNVATLIKPPKLQRGEIEILTADQIADTLRKIEDHDIYPVAVLAFTTGARRGELCGLRWCDVDLDAATIRIERSIEQTAEGLRTKAPKTAAGRRTLSLPAFAVNVIRGHRKAQLELRIALGMGKLPDEGPLFADVDGEITRPDKISDRWRYVVASRQLPKVTFHALRHSHASALIAAGLDVVSVSRRLGHASPALTLAVYSHLFKNTDDTAAAAIDAALAQ